MKKNSEFINFFVIGILASIIAGAIFFAFPQLTHSIDDFSSWYVYSLSKKSFKKLKIIGIPIDDNTIKTITGRWPFPRSVFAQVIKILDNEKVNTIGIDLVFNGKTNDVEDFALEDALRNASSKVVLAFYLDPKTGEPVLPLPQFVESARAIGMLNSPTDKDEKVRRLRADIEYKGNVYYAFSLELCAAFLKQDPKNLNSLLYKFRDHSFPFDYLLKPKETITMNAYDKLTNQNKIQLQERIKQYDITTISFSDVLENSEGLKQLYGKDFLKNSLVLIYPEAEIIHDTLMTPLGKMPGGFVHLNGVTNILSRHIVKKANFLLIIFFALLFFSILYILRYFGFFMGTLFTAGIVILGIWGQVALGLNGIKIDYSYVAIFGLSFFISGSLYKYIYFLAQLIKIKDKATLDPLTSLFTLRYFHYRISLETQKIYFGRDLYLVFMCLESLKDAFEDMSIDKIRKIWQEISSVVLSKGKFWSVYSQNELVGCIVSSKPNITRPVNSLKINLQTTLSKHDIKTNIKLAYLRLNKNYPIEELLFHLSGELKKRGEEVVLFKDSDLSNIIDSADARATAHNKILDSLDADIEDKNRELMYLVEKLKKEHAKTKEAFFQIITSLVNALEARDPYTEGHSERVCSYALMMAEKLGWPPEEKDKLKKAALLHDLGKIGIPDSILHKQGQLNDVEFDFIRKHEIIGVRILEPLKEMKEILPWILYHHERWDGKGYPHGLGGDAIPEASQILSLADVFDALTTGRDYKKAMSSEEAIEQIIKNKGTQFNPRLADIFLNVISSLHSG